MRKDAADEGRDKGRDNNKGQEMQMRKRKGRRRNKGEVMWKGWQRRLPANTNIDK